MRGKRIFVVVLAAVFLVASATSASSTSEGRVALARIAPRPKPAIPVVLVAPTTTTTTSTTVPVPSRGTVSLTFDDGPSAEWTPQVLDILARYQVRATFFLVGDEIAPNRAIVRRMVREGHVIGNHTWNHVALPTLDEAGFVEQVDRTQALLHQFSDHPATCVRPPYGKIDGRSRAALRARGLGVVRWSQDSEDWKRPGVDSIITSVLGGAVPNAVVLMHDSGPDMSQTVAALPTIIEGIHARGLSFAPSC